MLLSRIKETVTNNTRIKYSQILINSFLAKEESDEKFINLNRLRQEGSLRQVDAPKQLIKPAIQGRTKVVSIFKYFCLLINKI